MKIKIRKSLKLEDYIAANGVTEFLKLYKSLCSNKFQERSGLRKDGKVNSVQKHQYDGDKESTSIEVWV